MCVHCPCSKVNVAMLEAHKAMYAAAQKGDLAAFNRQRSEIIRNFVNVGVQNALKYAELMDAARAANKPEVAEAEQVGDRGLVYVCADMASVLNEIVSPTLSKFITRILRPPLIIAFKHQISKHQKHLLI